MNAANTLSAALPLRSTQRSDSDAIRLRALERLHQRKAVLDDLIQSLEKYQDCLNSRPGVCEPFTALRKCS